MRHGSFSILLTGIFRLSLDAHSNHSLFFIHSCTQGLPPQPAGSLILWVHGRLSSRTARGSHLACAPDGLERCSHSRPRPVWGDPYKGQPSSKLIESQVSMRKQPSDMLPPVLMNIPKTYQPFLCISKENSSQYGIIKVIIDSVHGYAHRA